MKSPCPCVRDVANQKCRRCQRLEKPCKPVSTQLVRWVAAALADPADHGALYWEAVRRQTMSLRPTWSRLDLSQPSRTVSDVRQMDRKYLLVCFSTDKSELFKQIDVSCFRSPSPIAVRGAKSPEAVSEAVSFTNCVMAAHYTHGRRRGIGPGTLQEHL
jgi:hypothetical protein